MGGLGTNHSLVRINHGIDEQGLASRAVKGEEHPRLLAKLLAELRFRSSAIFIIAVGQRVVLVHAGDGVQNLGTHARMVVASKSSFHSQLFSWELFSCSVDMDHRLYRHCGLDPQSPEYKNNPYYSGDGGCPSAMTVIESIVFYYHRVSKSNYTIFLASSRIILANRSASASVLPSL